jgi:hypothetical protein
MCLWWRGRRQSQVRGLEEARGEDSLNMASHEVLRTMRDGTGAKKKR